MKHEFGLLFDIVSYICMYMKETGVFVLGSFHGFFSHPKNVPKNEIYNMRLLLSVCSVE